MKFTCSNCQSIDLSVTVSAVVALNQDNGTQTFDSSDAELDWNGDSIIICNKCGTSDYAHAFEQLSKAE
ncbi:hypothetical protein QUN99_003440 [Vibrio parahaemolyticus]|nr:hypothetical protein [Vibrio parahaemolyticus]